MCSIKVIQLKIIDSNKICVRVVYIRIVYVKLMRCCTLRSEIIFSIGKNFTIYCEFAITHHLIHNHPLLAISIISIILRIWPAYIMISFAHNWRAKNHNWLRCNLFFLCFHFSKIYICIVSQLIIMYSDAYIMISKTCSPKNTA